MTITERATHGEIVTWSANGSYKQTTIVQALRNNSLNESEARNLVVSTNFGLEETGVDHVLSV